MPTAVNQGPNQNSGVSLWLHAQSSCKQHQARNPLSETATLTIGRRPDNQCAVFWDPQLSRQHAHLEVLAGGIQLTCLPHARNPLVVDDRPCRNAIIPAGSSFRIGSTSFAVTIGRSKPEFGNADVPPDEVESTEQLAYDSAELRQVAMPDSADQMQILCDLPDIVSAARSDIDLAATLAEVILNSIPQAVAVAAIECELSDETSEQAVPVTLRVATRESYSGRFRPSRRLMTQALRSQKSVVYRWNQDDNSPQATISDNLNWAFCIPLSGSAGGWCLYVAGEGGVLGGLVLDENELKADLKFTQVLGRFITSFRQVRQLQEQKTRLSSFFSPKVIENITSAAAEDALSASESDVTVLFCDVRGFSRKAEEHKDNLPYLLECVREALGVMTQKILQHDGAIADFQGDAALGFWGWPVAPENGAVPACLSALAIQRVFDQGDSHGPLNGFSVGLGIAHGRAIAGQIGTQDLAKIGVFGPVVNQGARLESMTRQFDVSIIVDEATAEAVRKHLPTSVASVRKLAHVRPKGMDIPVVVYELVSGDADVSPHYLQFESALEHIVSGNWNEAMNLLETAPDDGPGKFLIQQIHECGGAPPVDWDGAFSLTRK
jgi:adenylate cyclase